MTVGRGVVSVLAEACSVLGVTVGAGAGSAAPTDRSVFQIRWGACDPERTQLDRTDVDSRVACGTMRLPVDWSRPDGPTFVTRVYKQAASGTPKGTAISFPSGPGETADVGFTTIADVAPGYDLIGIDPRGVASTSPVRCSVSALLAAPLVTPADPMRFSGTRTIREGVARSCRTTPASLIDHLDAYSNARDAEAFRKALGVPSLLVAGTSYGTLTGARYLELYGDRAVGAVLDGVLNPGEPLTRFEYTAAAASQQLFDEFVTWCGRTESCGIRSVGVRTAFATAQRNADEGRISGRTAYGKKWDAAGVVQTFEFTAGSGDFDGAARAIAALAGGRNPDSTGSIGAVRPGQRMPYPDAVVCSDFDLGIRDAATAVRVADATSRGDIPYNTNAAQYTVVCAGATRPGPRAATPFRAKGDFPILLLSNRLDIATPKAWAQQVARTLGPRARQIVTGEIGHGAMSSVSGQVRAYIDGLKTAAAG